MRFSLCGREEAVDLVDGEPESQAHHDDVGDDGLAHEPLGPAPVAHHDEDREEREDLSDLDPDVEGQQVPQEAILGDVVFDDLRGEAGAVEEAEDQRRCLGIWLEAEPFPVGAEVVERFVNHAEPDDRVDDVGIYAPSPPDAGQHRQRVPDSEDADIDGDVLHPVEEEDNAQKEQDVVVTRHHVLGA